MGLVSAFRPLRSGASLTKVATNRPRCPLNLIRERIPFLGRPASADFKNLHGQRISDFIHFEVFGGVDLHIQKVEAGASALR